MTDPLVGVDIKLRRADELLREFRALVDDALSPSHYRFDSYIDPDTGHLTYLVRDLPRLDPVLSMRVGEILHHLRSCLDHLAWQLVILDGQAPTDKTYFPIRRDQPQSRNALLPPIRSQPILELVEACQPYSLAAADATQNPARHHLWWLHRLDIIDKHRLLLTTLCVLDLDRMYWGGPPAPSPRLNTAGLVEGGFVASFDFGDAEPPPQFDPHMTLKVVVNEPEVPWIRHVDIGKVLEAVGHFVTHEVVQPFRALFE